MVDPDKGFVLRTDASDYAVGAVLEQVRDDGTHVPVAFWSRILAEGQRRTWTAREKETYAIVCALRKWSGHIGLQPVVVCTDHQSLQSWHKEHVDTPSGPAARRARWHETFAKFDLSVVYVPGKDNTVADCLSRWAYPAGKAWMDISSHGDAEENEEAKRIIEMEKAMEQEGVKCFVVMANRTDLAKFRGARVQAIREETLQQWMVAPVELVRSVLTEDWSDDYAASDHWSKYWNAVSAPLDDEWPEGLTEDGDKLFLKDKLLVPENRMEELIGVSLLRVFDTAGYGRIRQDTAGYGRIRQDTAGYGRIRQDTAGYGRIRQIRQDTAGYAGYGRIRQDTQDTAGYGRIRQDTADTAGYGRIRQDTAGYDRVQNICLFALRKQPFCVHSAFGGISYCSCMPIVTFPADNPLHVHQLFVSKKKKIATCFLSLVVFHPVPACPLCCFCLG